MHGDGVRGALRWLLSHVRVATTSTVAVSLSCDVIAAPLTSTVLARSPGLDVRLHRVEVESAERRERTRGELVRRVTRAHGRSRRRRSGTCTSAGSRVKRDATSLDLLLGVARRRALHARRLDRCRARRERHEAEDDGRDEQDHGRDREERVDVRPRLTGARAAGRAMTDVRPACTGAVGAGRGRRLRGSGASSGRTACRRVSTRNGRRRGGSRGRWRRRDGVVARPDGGVVGAGAVDVVRRGALASRAAESSDANPRSARSPPDRAAARSSSTSARRRGSRCRRTDTAPDGRAAACRTIRLVAGVAHRSRTSGPKGSGHHALLIDARCVREIPQRRTPWTLSEGLAYIGGSSRTVLRAGCVRSSTFHPSSVFTSVTWTI